MAEPLQRLSSVPLELEESERCIYFLTYSPTTSIDSTSLIRKYQIWDSNIS